MPIRSISRSRWAKPRKGADCESLRRSRAPAASSPARSPTWRAAPTGSSEDSSPIRTRRSASCSAWRKPLLPRTARSARRSRQRWRPEHCMRAAGTSRSRSPASQGRAAVRRQSPSAWSASAGRRAAARCERRPGTSRGTAPRCGAHQSNARWQGSWNSWRTSSPRRRGPSVFRRKTRDSRLRGNDNLLYDLGHPAPSIERTFYAIIVADWPFRPGSRRAVAAAAGGLRRSAILQHEDDMPLDPRTTPMDDKSKALAAALAQIEKQFGKGSIMKMGESQIQNDLQVVSTGSLGLDIALGVGGLPRGRVVEIYGPEASGKTTLCLQVVAQVQKAGGTAAYIDAENALDPVYAGKLGVDVGNLLISQPDTGEQGLEIADMLVRSGGVDIIVIDSVAALVPKAEIEGEMGDQLPGLQARLMSQALRKLASNIKRANVLVIFINQIRMKIGVMFGNPETTTGGNALKFYASVRLDIRRIGAIKRGEEVVGNETRVKVVKNKVSPPFKEALFDILYGEGISREGEMIELGVNHRIIEKSGAWYAYNGEKIGQGKDNTREFLREHPEMAQEIETKIRGVVGVPVPGALRARGEPPPEE